MADFTIRCGWSVANIFRESLYSGAPITGAWAAHRMLRINAPARREEEAGNETV